jgi:hypothetical protein
MSVQLNFGPAKKPSPPAPPKKPTGKSSGGGGGSSGGPGFWSTVGNYVTDPSNWLIGSYVAIPHDENTSFMDSVTYIQNMFRHSSKYDNAELVLLDEKGNVIEKITPDAVHMKNNHHAEVIHGDTKFTFDTEGHGTYKGTPFSSVEVRWEDAGLKTFKI